MSTRTRSTLGFVALAFIAMPGTVGCQTDLTELLRELQNFDLSILSNVNQLQTVDPRNPGVNLPGGRNPMITDGVDQITDPGDQIDPDTFEDSFLMGIENTSAYDMYVEYLVDDVMQAVYVFEGETLLLEYECASSVEITLEEDYDPFDFTLVEMHDWTGTIFNSPDDFECGAAMIVTLDGVTVSAEPDVINLNTGFGPGMGPDDGIDDLDDLDDGMDDLDDNDMFL
ncbi:MAG: hypothetical protein H6819_01375 [Phycisphaerales bacterium]|nr:hypothetical protein [Phycisphaerales bacterium]MCB9857141.1 hypothetical protein [Phycisphaerales bacterium]MCB9861732.1 hypothetical protein [Phycisphaerales bacterium]